MLVDRHKNVLLIKKLILINSKARAFVDKWYTLTSLTCYCFRVNVFAHLVFWRFRYVATIMYTLMKSWLLTLF